jgi:hypothetical protein
MAYRWNAKAPKQRVSFFFTVWLTSIFATDGLALDCKFRARSGLGMSFAKGWMMALTAALHRVKWPESMHAREGWRAAIRLCSSASVAGWRHEARRGAAEQKQKRPAATRLQNH